MLPVGPPGRDTILPTQRACLLGKRPTGTGESTVLVPIVIFCRDGGAQVQKADQVSSVQLFFGGPAATLQRYFEHGFPVKEPPV